MGRCYRTPRSGITGDILLAGRSGSESQFPASTMGIILITQI